ncbi:Abi family protein [Embleya sp. NPDC056575]|uniref:Abi family protein n=1 Tax=unclassified Embleya TaxID=2699296 RepID=UPI0036BF6BCA
MARGARETSEADRVVEAISPERFKPFLHKCGGDYTRALRLYAWDAEVARALHSPLRDLEVSLRNLVHRQLVGRHGQEAWWDVSKARPNYKGLDMLDRAQQILESRHPSRSFGPCDIVAQLPFGFWVSLFGSAGDYELRYWKSSLRYLFSQPHGGRGALYRQLQYMLTLRNRIAHHERIFQRHLEQDLETVLTLLGHVSPDMAARHAEYGQVSEVLARKAGVLSGKEPIRL